MTKEMISDKATLEWLDSYTSKSTHDSYIKRWKIWIQYCELKGLPVTGSAQLEDMKHRRLSTDNTVKFFYDTEVPRYFQWLSKEYKGETTNKPMSESSALQYATAVRSLFAYHRYSLEIQKDKLPTVEKVAGVYEDHAFDIYQLRAMFQQGDLQERTVLSCGKDLWLRVGDFQKLPRDLVELAIKREDETAEAEKRESDIIEFELITEKEKEPCSCHLSRESIELLRDHFKTYPKNEYVFKS